MRFLVNELEYETPLAGGMYRFSANGTPLGVTEWWRVTSAPEQYKILRADVDARPSLGMSLLMHMVVAGNNHPERLVYRWLLDDGEAIAGNILFEDGVMIHRQTIGTHVETDERPETPFIMPPFLFGLGMLAQTKPATITTLNDALQLEEMTLSYIPQRTRNLIPIKVGRNTFTTTRLGIMAGDTTYTIWRDKQGYPVKMERSDGIVGEDVRPMRYVKPTGGKLKKRRA